MVDGQETKTAPTPDDPLWAAIRDYPFDDPDAASPWSARLSRENGWPPGYTRAVIEEYRRFLYLAARAETLAVPSEDVDQAWHLHLLYSEDYWNRLCGEVLGRPLHHGPATGADDDRKTLRAAYEETLDRYRAAFGEPPEQIWPPARARFRDGGRFRRVDRTRYWVVPKLRTRDVVLMLIGIVGIAVIWID
jgi:hypothetical protein